MEREREVEDTPSKCLQMMMRCTSIAATRRLQLFTASRRMSSGTYYDSQSGQHVPIYDESKVFAYLRSSIEYTADNQGGVSTIMDLMNAHKSLGLAGSVVNFSHKDGDTDGSESLSLLQKLSNINEHLATSSDEKQESTVFIRLSEAHQLTATQQLPTFTLPSNFNVCYEYSDNATRVTSITGHATTLRQSSIGIFDPKYFLYRDPISIASGVANLIDATASNGSSISNIILDPPLPDDTLSCDDEMVRLSEELSYLDVTGPTIKSRLIVAAHNTECIEECLNIGISKFIVTDKHALHILREGVVETGKQLIVNK